MKPADAVAVLRKTAAYQPNQRLDEATGQAWAEALAPYERADALEAVTRLGTAPRRDGEPFWFELRDIISEINRMRQRRYDDRRHLLPQPPPEVADDPAAYRDWLRDTAELACARDWTPPPALEAPGRPDPRMARLVGRIGRSMTAETARSES